MTVSRENCHTLTVERQIPCCDRPPFLTYLGLQIWNPGFPPTSMEILRADGGPALHAHPHRAEVFKQQGGAKSFALGEGFYCLRLGLTLFNLVRTTRSL